MVENRFIKIRNVLAGILVLNWLVALAKIVYGYMTRCNSMAADGFHSFSDGTSNVIGLIAIIIASSPPDKEHPYGHRKYETFASIAIAMLLFLISFNLIKSAIINFQKPLAPDVTYLSFAIMLFTTLVNIAVVIYERKRAGELKSDFLLADAEHTKSDILISVSVIFTLFAIKAGFPMMDTVIALIIAVLIGKSAIEILRASSNVLCDKAAIVSDSIKQIVMQISGVKDCHSIRTRGRSDDIHVDLHVTVEPSMHVGHAHEITERIEQGIKNSICGVSDVVVHIEPEGAHSQSTTDLL